MVSRFTLRDYLCKVFLLLLLFSCAYGRAQTLPAPAHIVVVILENESFARVVDDKHAPYLHSIATDTNTAVFTNCYALTHPSQPNYLNLFSGSDQGCADDDIPSGNPFTTPNMGAELIAAGKTFVTFSEGLPSTGFRGATGGSYARKHNPAVNWQGNGPNQLPITVNQPLTALPAGADYSTLPTICYIVPNLMNDMHNGAYPLNIERCDAWLQSHIDGLKQWALSHNTLLVITCDEDDDMHNNRIPALFYGAMVKGGQYSEKITHYNLLRTFEDIYGLGHAGKSAGATAVVDCWTMMK